MATPVYLNGAPDPSKPLDLNVYTRPLAIMPSNSNYMDPRASWADPALGLLTLYDQGKLFVPSTSAFGRPIKPSDLDVYLSAAQQPEEPVVADDLAPVTGGADAQEIFEWMHLVLSTFMPSPGARPPGYCLFCRQWSYNLLVHLTSFGPHGEFWARAIEHGGLLSLADWRRLVLFTGVWILINKSELSPDEFRAFKWLVTQKDLIPFEEDAFAHLYPLPHSKTVTPELEWVLPFVPRLIHWAKETNEDMRKLRLNEKFSNSH